MMIQRHVQEAEVLALATEPRQIEDVTMEIEDITVSSKTFKHSSTPATPHSLLGSQSSAVRSAPSSEVSLARCSRSVDDGPDVSVTTHRSGQTTPAPAIRSLTAITPFSHFTPATKMIPKKDIALISEGSPPMGSDGDLNQPITPFCHVASVTPVAKADFVLDIGAVHPPTICAPQIPVRKPLRSVTNGMVTDVSFASPTINTRAALQDVLSIFGENTMNLDVSEVLVWVSIVLLYFLEMILHC